MEKQSEIIKNYETKKIGGVSLIKGGLRGMEIVYEVTEILDGVSSISDVDKTSRRPVHQELRDLMKDLGVYLFELTGYPESYNLERIGDLEIVSVKAGSDRFIISGKFGCWGDKIISLNTPLIKEVDEYDKFDEVIELVDRIYKETDLYMQGVKRAGRKEIIVDWVKQVKKDETFSFETFDSMTPEEQELLMAEIEKDMGLTVHEEGGKMVIGASVESTELPLFSESSVTEMADFEVGIPIKGENVVITRFDRGIPDFEVEESEEETVQPTVTQIEKTPVKSSAKKSTQVVKNQEVTDEDDLVIPIMDLNRKKK